MKSLLFIIVATVFFVGCSVKENVTYPQNNANQTKNTAQKSEQTKSTSILGESFPFEENPILEEDVNFKRIAIIYPSRVVGVYAKSTISTVSAFLIYNDTKFELEAFDTYDENPMNIEKKIQDLKTRGFKKVIAMFTKTGFETVNNMEDINDIKFYFPLINKNEVQTLNSYFIFGGISYEKQLGLLESLSSGKNTMFYVKSYLGNKLKEIYQMNFQNPGVIKELARQNNRYKYIMDDERIIENTIVLNTPIVKTSIILSQLTAFEIMPEKVLSTQLNYNPLLIKLTQPKDRENFYVVSAISEVDNFIEDYGKLLGADITYNWVDYSALVGVNYLINENSSNVIKTLIMENQAEYEQTLYKSTSYGFQKVLSN